MPRKKLLKKLFAGSLAIMLGLCELSYTPPPPRYTQLKRTL